MLVLYYCSTTGGYSAILSIFLAKISSSMGEVKVASAYIELELI
jgi:hypothetical protein